LHALLISHALGLNVALAAVQFDYQAGIRADEGGDVGCDRVLAAELRAFELAVARPRPSPALDLGLGAAQASVAAAG